MASRHADWLRQAESDLDLARAALVSGHYEWSCFASQPAAEKALKAVFQRMSMQAWGHMLTALIGRLPAADQIPASIVDACKALDKHYIPSRYPYVYDTGAPMDYYTAGEARVAIRQAQAILARCQRQAGPPCGPEEGCADCSRTLLPAADDAGQDLLVDER
jgi:HEPN domain-containing protein